MAAIRRLLMSLRAAWEERYAGTLWLMVAAQRTHSSSCRCRSSETSAKRMSFRLASLVALSSVSSVATSDTNPFNLSATRSISRAASDNCLTPEMSSRPAIRTGFGIRLRTCASASNRVSLASPNVVVALTSIKGTPEASSRVAWRAVVFITSSAQRRMRWMAVKISESTGAVLSSELDRSCRAFEAASSKSSMACIVFCMTSIEGPPTGISWVQKDSNSALFGGWARDVSIDTSASNSSEYFACPWGAAASPNSVSPPTVPVTARFQWVNTPSLFSFSFS
mmetsp:Transcript_11888/g.21855  ORF Transcript_11888/g.21855 Transcript_11888/m.21855 type:complete len:281 (-) Transcript_11888:165-1007(-)